MISAELLLHSAFVSSDGEKTGKTVACTSLQGLSCFTFSQLKILAKRGSSVQVPPTGVRFGFKRCLYCLTRPGVLQRTESTSQRYPKSNGGIATGLT